MFYEGVDSLDNFSTQEELDNYRSLLLKKSAPQSDFIARLLGRPFSALELCCGNGRLLIDLAARGLIERGVGLDLAESRIQFARKWMYTDLQLYLNLRFDVADVRNLDVSHSPHYDISMCLTGALQYFKPIDMLEVLDTMANVSKIAVIELYNIPQQRAAMLAINNGHLRTWDALPAEDPFAYYMDDYIYDSEVSTMRHEKVFIHRSGRIDAGRVEMLHYYDKEEIICMLAGLGYKSVELYADWDDSTYNNGADKMIVVGRV